MPAPTFSVSRLRVLWPAVLGSLLLHLLLLLGWSLQPVEAGAVARGGGESLLARLGQPESTAPPALVEALANNAQAEAPPESPASVSARPPQQASGSGRALPAGVRPEYVPVERLSRKPGFVGDIQSSLLVGLDDTDAGSVTLQLLIGAGGRVDQVLVEASTLGEEGTRRLVQGLMAQMLMPGELDGVPVRARWRLAFDVEALAPANAAP